MFKNYSISRNLTFGLGLAILITGCLCLGLFYTVQITKGKQQIEQLGEEYIQVISDTLRLSLWNLNAESVKLTSSAYASNGLIVFISVKDAVGNSMFYHDNRKEMVSVQLHTSRINYEGEYVGTIELALTDFFLKKQAGQVISTGILLILVCFFCLALMTSFLLKRFLKDPLNSLRFISSEYAKGNFNADILAPKHIEFREFATALNDMGKTIESQVATLQKAEEYLKQNSAQLEEAVAQRTEELRAHKQRLEAILKASPVGIGLIIDRRMDWANDAMYKMVGYGKDELLGKSSSVLYKDSKEYERVGKELYNSIVRKEYEEIETQLIRKDGILIECNVRAYSLVPDDPSKGQIVAVSDISKAKLLEAKLQRAEKMEAIGTLAGGVAHDLNNILSGIVSYPELLLTDIPGTSPLRKPLLTIQKSGEKAARIVQDLLTMARRGVSVTEVTNINLVISDQLLSPEMKKLLSFHQGIQIISNLDDNLLNVKGSPTHLAKSIMNLFSNAAEAMPAGGAITISTANVYLDRVFKGYEQIAEGAYVRVDVSDNGMGISPKDIEKIFEPFYTKKSMARSGTGLGMAVVWGTVKDHDGYIDIESVEGIGTTITFYIPATREDLKEKPLKVSLDEYLGNGESILIVDDVEEQREVATAMLKKLGYAVLSVASGEEAIKHIKANPPDLLILDMVMEPGLDGLDTYKQILEIHPQQRAVIASGFSRTDRVKELQKLGAGRYIKKPYTLFNIGFAVKEELRSDHSASD
ncbi:MAG: response regulator [Desulfobulbaceae bacterium]|nr:response regulator [Desulfobulbaceae bacterium]